MKKIKSGIYCVRNFLDGKRYVGSAENLRERENNHFSKLQRNAHPNMHIQSAVNKYGIDSFVFEVLEYVENLESLLEREDFWIDFYKSNNNEFGYNARKIPNSNLGMKFSEETRKKISEALSGEKNGFYGRKHSEESKKLMSESHLENPLFPHPMSGKKHSEESKKKMSDAKKGKPLSEETKKKLSGRTGEKSSNYGKKASEETRRRLSESHKGKVPSQETRDKLAKKSGGENSLKAKITEKQALDIKGMLDLGIRGRTIAEFFDISDCMVSDIKNGRTWKRTIARNK